MLLGSLLVRGGLQGAHVLEEPDRLGGLNPALPKVSFNCFGQPSDASVHPRLRPTTARDLAKGELTMVGQQT